MKTMWNADDYGDQDSDLETHVYFKPEEISDHAPQAYNPGITQAESRELEERFTLPALVPHAPTQFPHGTLAMPVPRRVLETPPAAQPVFIPSAPQPQVFIPRPVAPRTATQMVRRPPPRSRIGLVTIGFAALCVLSGIAIGGAFSLAGKPTVAVAAPSTPPARFTAPSEPIVTPIIVPPPAPAPAPVAAPVPPPILVVPPPPAPIAPPVVVAQPAPVVTPTAPQPAVAHHHHHAAPVVVAVAAPAPAPVAAARGTLQISAKPPCQILIDGKSTGLTTPQRSITLAAGGHDVTFVNASQGIHLTAHVDVSADHATQLVRDFTD